MFEAILQDLAKLPYVQLSGLWDGRLGKISSGMKIDLQTVWTESEHQAAYMANARDMDATLLIAPESEDQLHVAAKRVIEAGGQLLGPSPELIDLTSYKSQLARHLAAHGVPVQAGVELEIDERIAVDFNYPAILKPNDGAGSQQTWLVFDATEAEQRRPPMRVRMEAFHPGKPVSVAVLCGPACRIALPACRQGIEITRNCIQYQGGVLPLSGSQSKRATRLALRAVDTLHSPLGFLGVDLMLGDDTAGNDDVVLEINPRLTTSYVGLRAAVDVNLAELMLDVIAGESPELCLNPKAVEFSADGRVWFAEQAKTEACMSSTNE